MSFLNTGFSVNGERSEDYGVVLVAKGDLVNQQFGVSSKAVREKIKYRDEPYSYGFERNIYNMPIAISKIDSNDMKFTYEERIRITKWLKGNDEFVEFCSDDYDEEHIFYLHFNSGDFENYSNNMGIVTFDCEMKYPYAMSPVLYDNFDLSDNNSSEMITLVNNSNVVDYYSPMIEFKLIGSNTGFKMINHTNNEEIFEFTGLTAGDTICIDNLNKRIKSSTGLPRLSNFNKKWLSLSYGINQIEVFGACILDVKSQFPMAL